MVTWQVVVEVCVVVMAEAPTARRATSDEECILRV